MTNDEQDWFFTFGQGHTDSDGKSLFNKYTKIRGTCEGARLEMFKRYGRKWGFQYASAEEAGVDKFDLEEI